MADGAFEAVVSKARFATHSQKWQIERHDRVCHNAVAKKNTVLLFELR